MRERSYQKLVVWKEAHELCKEIYKITASFPDSEKFGLVSQMRRSAHSVPMNIAEGNTRRTKPAKRQFIEIAEASLEELHYQTLLAVELGYIKNRYHEDLDNHIQRIGFLIHKLYRSLS